MQLISRISALRERLGSEPRVAFVPTMGNLHEGHLSLVEIARQHADFVVVSIFVNRLQFEPGGDFERYPRTLAEDCARLEAAGVDVVFAPDEAELYPEPQEVLVEPPASLAAELEGSHRPGHFRGMATVVLKLLNIVQPQAAVFGKKDYQQLKIVEALVRQLNLPVWIVPGETVRAPDGLALSSRNGYLTPRERAEAVRLNQRLRWIQDSIRQGRRDYAELQRQAAEDLSRHGWRVDYVAVRQKTLLQLPAESDRDLVVLGAAWLGTTRLIDNVEIEAG